MLEKVKELNKGLMEADSLLGRALVKLGNVESLLNAIELAIYDDECDTDAFRLQFEDMKNLHQMARVEVSEVERMLETVI